MSESSSPKPKNRWKRRFFVLLVLWISTSVLLSFAPVRAFVSAPLIVHDGDAEAQVAYVMADGPASWERLRAASDLYHWERVEKIYVLNELEGAGYDFVLRRTQPRVERVTKYLMLHGVPEDAIETIEHEDRSIFGSLNEARSFAAQVTDVESLVIVTSPGHTRRSVLSFRRSLPESVKIKSYAAGAGDATHSAEIHWPLWIEYAKLGVYWFVA